MTLLQLIDRTLLEPIDGKRFRSLRTILADFPEGDVDILLTAVPGWAQRFVDFLSRYPNRLRKDTYLSPENQGLYLVTLRKLLRKAVAWGLYPDLDPVLPFIADGDKSHRGPRRPEDGIPDHRAELLNLCSLRLEGKDDALRRLYYIGLLAGGLEITDLLTLRIVTDGPRLAVATPTGTILRHSEAILSLAAPLSNAPQEADTPLIPEQAVSKLKNSTSHSGAIEKSSHIQNSTHTPSPSHSGAIEKSDTIQNSKFKIQNSIFSSLICMAAPMVPTEALTAAISTRLLTPEKYLADLPRYQTLFTGTFSDGGALVPRWFALRSVNPRKSGEDVHKAIAADESLSPLVDDTYVPTDSIIVERRGRKITRNHPAVNKLIFIKTVSGTIPKILHTVDDVAAYRRGRVQAYATVPYAEIYRMQLVLGAVGSDPHTDILTDEELHSHFDTSALTIGDTVTVARPGYEQFTARVIRQRGHDTYCVSFQDFGFHVIMDNLPRALIKKI